MAVSPYVFVEAGVPITSCIMGHDHFEAISLLRRNNIINVGTTNNVYTRMYAYSFDNSLLDKLLQPLEI